MGILGFMMSYFEKTYIKYISKRKYRLDIRKIKENSAEILDKNFISDSMQLNKSSNEYNTITVSSSINIKSAKVHDESIAMSNITLQVYDLDI
jgi:hypothetical protein